MQTFVFLLLICALVFAQPVDLTTANFAELSKGLWFVKLFAPWCGHCKALAPTWDKLAQRLEGTKVKIGKVNCDENSSICSKYSIQGYPTVLLLRDGEKIAEYEGPRSVDAFVSYLSDATSEKKSDGKVVELSSKNFDILTSNPNTRWFVKFFAPWCGHCKHLEPIWQKLGKEFEGTDTFVGRVDCTTESEICSRFDVKGYPTLNYLVPPNKYVNFQGMRSLEVLSDFAKNSYKTRTLLDRPKPGPTSFLQLIMNNPIYIILGVLVIFLILLIAVGICICLTDNDRPMPPPRKPRPSALESEIEQQQQQQEQETKSSESTTEVVTKQMEMNPTLKERKKETKNE